MCLGVLPASMSAHHLHAWSLQRPEEWVTSSRIGVTDGCELLYGCQELNLVFWMSTQCFISWVVSPVPHIFEDPPPHWTWNFSLWLDWWLTSPRDVLFLLQQGWDHRWMLLLLLDWSQVLMLAQQALLTTETSFPYPFLAFYLDISFLYCYCTYCAPFNSSQNNIHSFYFLPFYEQVFPEFI